MLATIIILICFGVIMLGIEFVLPGAIIGILGIVALVAAVVLTFSEYGAGPGFLMAILVVVLTIVFFAVWVKYFHRTWFGKKLTLESEIHGNEIPDEKISLLGQSGVADTELRPSGRARIGDRKVDVVSEMGLIEKDTPVKVIKVEGLRVVVEKSGEPRSEESYAE